jgi:hypothetical protein
VPTDPNLDHLALPLGHLLIEFNSLEVDLGRLVARLLDQDDDHVIAIFGAQLMFFPRIKLARALVEAKINDRSERELYLTALQTAERCNTKRNQYIHSEYLPFVDETEQLIEVLSIPHRTRARLYGEDSGFTDPQDIIPADVAALIDEIQGVAYDIRVLAERYRDNKVE